MVDEVCKDEPAVNECTAARPPRRITRITPKPIRESGSRGGNGGWISAALHSSSQNGQCEMAS
eukprot:6978368-Pyramimonas_sp.AAC.1